MIKTSTKLLFSIIMMTSSIMVMSTFNWLNMWMALEVNMMTFIPLMFNSKNNFLSQSSMMYFLTQSMASIIFIAMTLKNSLLINNMWTQESMEIIMLSMMLKMGMPPFHMWYPEIMNKMSWMMCMTLSTWQKMAPMYVCSMCMNYSNMTLMLIMMSTIMGAILGMNQTSTRKIMAYSSINHLGWMLACTMSNKKSWIMYMIMYSMIMLFMCMLMFQYNIMYINQMNIKKMSMTEKMMLMFMMLSMGGMPPFLGFLPKWMAIYNMIMFQEYMLLMVMLWSSTITLFYYIRMTSPMNMTMMHSQKWMMNIKTKKMNIPMMLFINMALPMLMLSMNMM